MLKVVTDYIPIGHPNRPGIKLTALKARVWHGTANLNPGATDTMHRGYVGRAYVKKWNQSLGKYEFYEADGVTPFRFGAAQVYIDKDSATIMVPLDEYVPGSGDRPSNYAIYKGQTKIAAEVFNHQQNYQTIQIELCMNDMAAWDKVLENAIEFVRTYISRTDIADYRHYDITGKMCPSPMVDSSPNHCPAWVAFKERIRKALVTPKVPPDEVPVIQINGEIVNNKMDVKPFIKDGRVFVPVRFIAEAFGRKVNWIADEKICDIR